VTEEFRDIVGYEGLYQISSYGRVFSLVRGIFRAPRFDRYGYLRTTLYKDMKSETITIHIMVANAFLGKRINKHFQINHKDGDKTNNHPSNLEYVLPVENSQHAISLGLFTPRKYNRKLTDEQEVDIYTLYTTGNYTQIELGAKFNVSNQTISNVILYGKRILK
jgi:hypothetical protein